MLDLIDHGRRDVSDGWIVKGNERIAQTGKHGKSAGVENKHHECIIPGPTNVIDNKIGFAAIVKWRRVIWSNKVKELNDNWNRSVNVGEEHWTVYHMWAV